MTRQIHSSYVLKRKKKSKHPSIHISRLLLYDNQNLVYIEPRLPHKRARASPSLQLKCFPKVSLVTPLKSRDTQDLGGQYTPVDNGY